jgi:hypothetical protein
VAPRRRALEDPGNLREQLLGRRRGEPLNRIVDVEVLAVRRESLNAITPADVTAEGFPQMTPAQFVSFFCGAHHGCDPDTEITVIEWRYLGHPAGGRRLPRAASDTNRTQLKETRK